MDRWVEIDHPYEVVHLRFDQKKIDSIRRQMAHPLNPRQWDALTRAERRIFQGDPGSHGWTDVMPNDGDEFLNSIWSHTADYVQNEDFDGKGEAWQLHETARRVAQSLAIMAFGAEILING